MGLRGGGGVVAEALLLVLVAILTTVGGRSLCPTKCICNDTARSATCAAAGLDVVPIQLNPEAKLINLTDNVIENVHFTLVFYTQLITLDISHNRLNTLGSNNFESNTELQYLNFSFNAIAKLERHSFIGLEKLIDMNLSDNAITQIHGLAFHGLQSLQKLDISNNKIAIIEAGSFLPLKSLKYLSLKNNEILELPSSNLIHLKSLEYLFLSNNLIQNIVGNGMPSLSNLKIIDLNNNIISDVSPVAFDGLPSIQHLDLSDNNLTAVPIVALSKLSNLTHLYLSGNFFITIPAVAFQSLFRLKHLHLSKLHQLEKIDPRAFVDNTNLEHIWLNDNVRVEDIPPRLFHGNSKLTHIYMRNNRIVTIDASHIPVDQLVELQIAGNPFECNCTLQWLWKLAKEYASHSNSSNDHLLKIDFEEIRCAKPDTLNKVLLVDVSEYEIRCSLGWVIVASVVLTISVLLGFAGGILYFVNPMKNCKKSKSLQVVNNVMINNEAPKLEEGLVYSSRAVNPQQAREIDRYLMIGSSAYHQPWGASDKELYNDEADENIYQQFTYETIPPSRSIEKPHIVYV